MTHSRRQPHQPTSACHRDHCYSHNTDEPVDGRTYYQACGECYHLFRSRWNLWADYLRACAARHIDALRNPYHWSTSMGSPVVTRINALTLLAALPFTRPRRIHICPHCAHDL